jgi:hypothetical protein
MFQDDISHLRKVHDVIKLFSASSHPSHLVFILGVVNHWVTLLVYKSEHRHKYQTLREVVNIERDDFDECILHKEMKERIQIIHQCVSQNFSKQKEKKVIIDRDKDLHLDFDTCKSDVHLMFCDSNNFDSPGMKDEDVPDLVAKCDEEKLQRRGRRYTEWEKQNCKQSYFDQRDVIYILARCASGKSTFLGEYIDGKITTLVSNYKEHVSTPFKGGSDPCVFASLLLTWLEMYNRPKHIHDRVIGLINEVGVDYLGEVGRGQLTFLVSDILGHLDKGEWSSVPLIDEMIQVVLQIKHQLLE